ncbi:MAG: epoxyqueuosine reductase QueH [Lachnospiraceae bacterium]|nr:epoxyqueuosine reductase QueH [Lachnospiraceae bacterium]MBP3611231.1 epoxyqueuosine reductase QueH [Lachnospiraceae bacterium]
MQNRNYQKELEKQIEKQQREGVMPSLLLHSCCAPCSSYVLEYLAPYFKITDFYYNPNISPKQEYEERREELKRLIAEMGLSGQVEFLEGTYTPEEFFAMAKGMEQLPEGGERCFRCYEMRLRESAKLAKELGLDFFATTLTISPLKNAGKLNEIGEKLAAEYGVKYLASDFKKKNGYKRSVELSAEYELYRQNYCGCVFSKMEAEKREG